MNKIKVTVVLNFYNEEKYLSQAIESILNQTYKDFELILVDDASTDNSNNIARSFHDPRIRVVRNSCNRGAAYSRNVGMREACGEYIAFSDGDDYSLPDRIEVETNFLDNHQEVLAVSCWSNYIDENDNEIEHRKSVVMNNQEVAASLLFGNPFSNPGSMIRRTVFEKYGIYQKEDLRVSQDYYFWIQIIGVGELSIIPQELLNYRVHNSKASSFANKNKEQYDTLMIGLLNDAWKSKGFNLKQIELELVYKYLFCENVVWRVSTLIQIFALWKKVKCQSKYFQEADAAAIKRMFIIRLNNNLFILQLIKSIKNRLAVFVRKDKE